jgi:hypothetical protein
MLRQMIFVNPEPESSACFERFGHSFKTDFELRENPKVCHITHFLPDAPGKRPAPDIIFLMNKIKLRHGAGFAYDFRIVFVYFF